MVDNLDCIGIDCPNSRKYYSKIEQKKIIFALMYFVMKMT